MTLYNWSSPNTDPSFIQISILRPVLNVLLHAPPPYKIQDLAAPNNPFFWGGSVINEARAALRGFACNHKNIRTSLRYNRDKDGFLERV
mgnify:CR=1 FL=1